jgi:hypothetical protein
MQGQEAGEDLRNLAGLCGNGGGAPKVNHRSVELCEELLSPIAQTTGERSIFLRSVFLAEIETIARIAGLGLRVALERLIQNITERYASATPKDLALLVDPYKCVTSGAGFSSKRWLFVKHLIIRQHIQSRLLGPMRNDAGVVLAGADRIKVESLPVLFRV